MNFGKREPIIPKENVLDLRAPQSPSAAPSEGKDRKKHVDFLSAVEEGEHALSQKFSSWVHRFQKPKTAAGEAPVEPDAPPPSPPLPPLPSTPARASSVRYQWGPAVRFGVSVSAVLLVIIGARFVGNIQKVKGDVLGTSAQALQRISTAATAAQSLQFGTSKTEFAAAHDAFAAAEQQLDSVAGTLKDLPGAGKLARADALLQAGQAITAAAGYLAEGANALSEQTDSTTPPLLAVIAQFRTSLEPASLELQKAALLLQQVQPNDLPENYRQIFADIQSQLPSLHVQFQRLRQVGDFLQQFLAADGSTKHYLFVFQNSNELRPTGGFLGSLAVVDVQRGAIQKIDVPSGGVYDVSGQTSLRFIAPQPFRLVQPDWNLQDANWFPDFPTSAKKILQYYTSSGAAPVDGVMAVTPAVLQSFLALTGPVAVPEVGVTFTAEKFPQQLQSIIKQEETKDYSKPKLVLGYLAPKILDRVFSLPQTQLWQVLGVLQDHLITRDVQLYFTDSTIEQRVRDLGWSGELQTNDQDFLHINRANLGGDKTDAVMEEVDSHDVTVASDGTVTDTLTITRKHNGVPGDKFSGSKNTTYLRVYVPLGSTLVQADGFTTIDPNRFGKPSPGTVPDPDLEALDVGATIDAASATRTSTEAGHTVFANWLVVEPGHTAQVTLTYTLPLKLKVGGLLNASDTYSLLVQSQAGIQPAFSSILHLPSTWQATWKGSTADIFVQEADSQYRMSAVLDRDEYYGVVVKR